jgi:hypothetical protein
MKNYKLYFTFNRAWLNSSTGHFILFCLQNNRYIKNKIYKNIGPWNEPITIPCLNLNTTVNKSFIIFKYKLSDLHLDCSIHNQTGIFVGIMQ